MSFVNKPIIVIVQGLRALPSQCMLEYTANNGQCVWITKTHTSPLMAVQ